MTALILSGGGALGAFQAGAVQYAQEKGLTWNLIAGVSVGALNGAMISQGNYKRLYEIWSSDMRDTLVYGPFGRWVPTGLVRLRSIYSSRTMRKLIQRELGGGTFHVPLRVGALSLITGQYQTFDEQSPHILDAVLASATMPVISPPMRVGADRWLIDGGVRNTSPIGDVLKTGADRLVIINCFPSDPRRLPKAPRTLAGIGARSYEVMANEILADDIKEFLLINGLVEQAGKSVLRHPKDKRELRYVPHKIIEPDEPLGDGLDFTRESARQRFELGRQKAQQILV
jgi:NTE family protein